MLQPINKSITLHRIQFQIMTNDQGIIPRKHREKSLRQWYQMGDNTHQKQSVTHKG